MVTAKLRSEDRSPTGHTAATLLALLAAAGQVTACASTQLLPVPHPGEVTLRFDGGLEAWAEGPAAGGQVLISESPGWDGLREHVACVPRALHHATEASSEGDAATVLSAIAIAVAVGSLAGLGGALADDDHTTEWLGGSAGAAVVGLILAGSSQGAKTRADGNAVDAINFYNDEVARSGATCRSAGASDTP